MSNQLVFEKNQKADVIFQDKRIYPYSTPVEVRFQDLDPLGHVNNVAMASLYETARVKYHRYLRDARGVDIARSMIGSIQIDYIDEAMFGLPVTFYSGTGYIGESSWRLHTAGYQDDRCVTVGNVTLVYTVSGQGVTPIPDTLRACLLEMRLKTPE